MKHILISTAILISHPLARAQAPAAEPVFEQGVEMSAADLLPPELLRGPHHRVRDIVVTDGFLAHIEIDSDFGLFVATGIPQAKQRIREIAAIAKLVETSKSDLFAEGLKRSVQQPVAAVKNIAKDPVGSLKKTPATVGHFFGKVGSSIERGASRVKNAATGDAPAGDAGKGIGQTAKGALGFDKAKLDTAKQLGVDPYSDNARLQEEIEKVTWAFFAGGLPLKIGAAAASAGIALTATEMIGVPEETYALTSSELAHRDQESLTAMRIPKDDIMKFMTLDCLGTTRRHRIVLALAGLPKASGRDRVIRLANSCQSTLHADFLVNALALTTSRQQSGQAICKEFLVMGRLPAALTTTGTLEVPAPVDHVTWTEQVAAFARRDDLATHPRALVHTGTLSPAATAGFTAAGWTLAPVAQAGK